MPHPFQIVQSSTTILMADAICERQSRRPDEQHGKRVSPRPGWAGRSATAGGRDALVIHVTDQMEDTWFDSAGNFHSDALDVVEAWQSTAVEPNTLSYEVTIEDPKVFTRPWKMSMLLYRHQEKNAQLMEYKCVEFVEELMYGHLRKQPTVK